MFLVKLWDRYDREIFINIHEKATPPRRTLKQIAKTLKTLLIRSGISKKRRIIMNKEIMRAVGLGEEVDAVEAGLCPFCKQKILKNSFRDALSEKEFQISGLCQKCQDETFNEMEG